MNTIFGYKVINNKCGFPDNALNKVLEKLDKSKISYEIIYIDQKGVRKDFESNKYSDYYLVARKQIAIREKILMLEEKLNSASSYDLEILMELINEFFER